MLPERNLKVKKSSSNPKMIIRRRAGTWHCTRETSPLKFVVSKGKYVLSGNIVADRPIFLVNCSKSNFKMSEWPVADRPIFLVNCSWCALQYSIYSVADRPIFLVNCSSCHARALMNLVADRPIFLVNCSLNYRNRQFSRFYRRQEKRSKLPAKINSGGRRWGIAKKRKRCGSVL